MLASSPPGRPSTPEWSAPLAPFRSAWPKGTSRRLYTVAVTAIFLLVCLSYSQTGNKQPPLTRLHRYGGAIDRYAPRPDIVPSRHAPDASLIVSDQPDTFPTLDHVTARNAFVTLYCPSESESDEDDDDDDDDDQDMTRDVFLVGARILTYQLLHAPETRTKHDYPFIIFVTETVSEARRNRLRRDGAIVLAVSSIDPKWLVTEVDGWKDVLNKLYAWTLTQFDRVLVLDLDTIIARSVDSIFDDAAAQTSLTSLPNAPASTNETLPASYVFAAMMEMNQNHATPPTQETESWPNIDYLNSGLFVLRPSTEMLDVYLATLDTPGVFDPMLPEQNMFNHIHDRSGSMPWKQLDTIWGYHNPKLEDLQYGVHTLHVKWWAPADDRLVPFLQGWKTRMHAFQEARDLIVDAGGRCQLGPRVQAHRTE